MRDIQGLKTLKAKIEFLLEKYPKTRDDDTTLILHYLYFFNETYRTFDDEMKKSIVKMFRETPPMDSFKRLRAKCNQDGEHLGSSTVQKHRNRLDGEHKKIFAGGLL